jgi:membrane fusion protein, multidrug efflux system
MKPAIVGVVIVGLAAAGFFGWKAQQKADQPGIAIDGKVDAKAGAASGTPEAAGGKGSATGAPVAGAQGTGAPGVGAPGTGAPGAGAPAAGGRGPGGPVGVEVGKAQILSMAEEVTATGNLRARESVVLRSEIAGRIVQLGFGDGTAVKKGAVLISLDAALPQAELEQVRAEMGLAKSNFQRTQDLAQKNFVSERARDEAAANLKVVEARLQLAQARLARSQIRAPFNGVMGLRNVSVGDYVREGADIALMEDNAVMKVDLRLPEKLLGRVKVGQKIDLKFDAFPNQNFPAQILALDVTVDSNGRSVIARSSVVNQRSVLRTGMFARGNVILESRPQAIVVPEEAIVPIGADVFVFKVVDSKAQRVKIKTGLRKDGKVEVTEGLVDGDVVVTAGQIKLRGEGGDVRVIDPNKPRGPGGPGKDGGAPKEGAPAKEGAPIKDGASAKDASLKPAPTSAPEVAPSKDAKKG